MEYWTENIVGSQESSYWYENWSGAQEIILSSKKIEVFGRHKIELWG